MAKISAEEKEATRLRIMDASVVVFRRCGYEKTQIKEIAKEAGVGTSTIYGYYASKMELFLAAFMDRILTTDFDEVDVQEALKKGITDGLLELVFTFKIQNMLDDKELFRSFIAVSMYDNSEFMCKRKYKNHEKQYDFIKSVLEVYERTNLRLCAFSLNHLAQTIMTIIEHIGISYMTDDLTLEEAEVEIRNQIRVLLAGKYENL